MPQTLHFQLLPAIIIQRIVFYTNNISRNDIRMLVDRHDVAKGIQKNSIALSHTCKTWRTIMLGLMYHKCGLYTDGGYYLINSDRKATFSEFFDRVPYPKGIAHVRQLHIVTDIAEIILGKAVESLQSTNLGELYFPSVTELYVMLNPANPIDVECTNLIERIDAFVEYINRIVPNPVYVDFSSSSKISRTSETNLATDNDEDCSILNYLAERLFGKARRMSWSVGRDYSIPPNTVQMVPNRLTGIYCHIGANNEDVYRLVRINSQTLVTLELVLQTNDNAISQLIIDEEGTPVRYPYLRDLFFAGNNSNVNENREAFPDIAPFPRLHSLKVHYQYPFRDDVLFRDNANTLKVLHCNFDLELVEMVDSLVSKKIFKLPCLESLVIDFSDEDMKNRKQIERKFFEFLIQIGAGVKMLWLRNTDVASLVIENLRTVQGDNWGENICNLSVDRIYLKFQQVMDLLKALPNLERLASGFVEHESLLESLGDTTLLDQIHKEYYHAFPRFRIWEVNYCKENNIEFSAICSMLLALACPGFHGIRISKEYTVEYRETLKILSGLYPYRKYPWLAKRLLPGVSWRRTAATKQPTK